MDTFSSDTSDRSPVTSEAGTVAGVAMRAQVATIICYSIGFRVE